jgi:penicillin-binding protein 2
MAGNTVTDTIALSRLAAQQYPKVVGRLAALLGMTQAEIDATLADSQFNAYEPVPVMTDVPLNKVLYVRENQSLFPGVSVTLSTQRNYPYGTAAAHLLGYLGQITPAQLAAYKKYGYHQGDLIGQAGVEASYERWLRGIPGKTELEVDALGNVVGTLKTTPSTPGNNLVLTVDLHLQQYVDAALAQGIAKLHSQGLPAPSGAAVVMNPQNGSVLAMASYPTYSPSAWVGGISQANYSALTNPANHDPLFNRAIAGLYTPGSTFKIATATAALDSGLITPSTYINDPGYFKIPGVCSGKCSYHNAGGESLGPIQIIKAIAASDDVFFYTLGYRFWVNRSTYGPMPIQNMAHLYGLGRITGIPIPGEVKGQIDSPALRARQHAQNPKAFPYGGWYVGDNLEMAFGQGETLITPIELADAFATFANGGTRYQPRVAEAAVSASGKVVKVFPPVVTGHVTYAPGVHSTMLTGFEHEVTRPYGTGYGTFLGYPYSQLPIAGKTGTASVAHGTQPNALYVGFAPANATPRYVVCVVVKEGGYGATGAGPIARSIFQYLIGHPPRPVSLPTTGANGSSAGPNPAAVAVGISPHQRSAAGLGAPMQRVAIDRPRGNPLTRAMGTR